MRRSISHWSNDSDGERKIAEIVVMGSGEMFCSPCGNCRQMIREFSLEESRVHICHNEQIIKTVTINDLLPYSFNGDH